MLRKCMNEVVDSAINQISSSSFEWWSSFVCSLRFDLFHEVFWFWTNCLKHTWMRLWIAPSIRSRRAVPNDGPHLSVAYDLTCFMSFFGFESNCLKNAWMRLWIAPSIRSRRAVPNDGPHLSVAYDLACFIRFFGFDKKKNAKKSSK